MPKLGGSPHLPPNPSSSQGAGTCFGGPLQVGVQAQDIRALRVALWSHRSYKSARLPHAPPWCWAVGLLPPNALADALRAPCPSFPVPAASFPFTLCLELSLAPQKPDALGGSSAGRRVRAESQAAGVAHSPFALHLSGSIHCEISLLTKARGKQLVGDTPWRSCLLSSSQGWYAWLSHPTTEHTGAPSAQGQGAGWGPAQALGFAF